MALFQDPGQRELDISLSKRQTVYLFKDAERDVTIDTGATICPYWSQTSLSKGQTVYLLVWDKTNQLRERESTLFNEWDIYFWGKIEPSMHKNVDVYIMTCCFFK